MTDDIKLPPLPASLLDVETEARAYASAAVEADRQDHLRDATKMMPSDEEIAQLFADVVGNTEDGARFLDLERDHAIRIAHTLLSRYSIGQPAASAESDREKLMRAIVEAGQRAGIIRSDLETVSGTECLHILECLSPPAASAEPLELQGVPDALVGGGGFWRSCSGCHELDEGRDTGPYSKTLKCHLGNGCSECGGIGAIWDTTDYGAMGDAMARDMAAPVAQEPTESVLIDGAAYTIPAPVAAELLRLHIELKQGVPVAQDPVAVPTWDDLQALAAKGE